jgi:3D (Asp-Asp-Asp) domain-containing protein
MTRALSRGLLVSFALMVVSCGSTPGADTAVSEMAGGTPIPSVGRAATPAIAARATPAPNPAAAPTPVLATVPPPSTAPTGRETPAPAGIAPASPEPAATPGAAEEVTGVPESAGSVAACPMHEVAAVGYNGAEFGSSGVMANGKRVHWGAVAVDPRYIPLGTRMYISGFGEKVFVASDTGGAVKGWEIDIWFPSVERARSFTEQRRTVTMIGGPKERGRRCR